MTDSFASTGIDMAKEPAPSSEQTFKTYAYRSYLRAGPWFAEFIGSFMITFSFCTIWVLEKQDTYVSFGVGLTSMVMIFMGGHVSGAHYNPAVTFGVYLTHGLKAFLKHQEVSVAQLQVNVLDTAMYVVVQLCGAASGGIVAYATTGVTFYVGSSMTLPVGATFITWKAVTTETLYGCLVVFTYLGVSYFYMSKTQQNSYFGLAVAFTMMVGLWNSAPYSGGSINPLLATGAGIAYFLGNGSTAPLSTLWLYWVSSFIGAILASIVYAITHPREYGLKEDEVEES